MKKLLAAAMAAMAAVGAMAEDAYLEADGTQFVMVNYKANAKTRIVADFQYTDVSALQALFGSGSGLTGADGARICFWINGGANPETCINALWSGRFVTGFDTRRHQVELDVPSFKATLKSADAADIVKTHVSSTITTDKFPLGIFGSTQVSLVKGAYLAKARIYTFKVYEGDDLLLDLVPCRKGGQGGFYDTKSGDFYPSVTASDLVAGGDGVMELEGDPYVSSPDGKVSVMTDYLVNPDTCIEADFAFIDGETTQQFLFESDDTGNPYGRIYVTGQLNVGWTFHDTAAYSSFLSVADGKTAIPLVAGKRMRAVLDGGNSTVLLTCAGVTNACSEMTGTRTKTGKNPLRLFSNATGKANFGKVKLYGFKISENGVLLHDYRPMSCNGVGVLRDAVTGQTVFSNTSTPLSYGGPIKEEPYVESKGGQIVVLDYKANAKTVVEVEFSHFTKQSSTQPLFGTSALRLWQNGNGNQEFYAHGAWSGGSSGVPDGKHHTAVIDIPASMVHYRDGAYNRNSIDMTGKGGYKAEFPEDTYGLGVFRLNTSTLNANDTGAARVYSIRVTEDGELKRLYLPYVKNDEVGFRDQVTGNFFGAALTVVTDSTTKGLVGGGDIETDGKSPDAYVESDTSQYIQTGYFPKPNTKLELDFQMTQIKKDYYLMGCEESPYWRIYCNYLCKFTFLSHATATSSAVQTIPGDYQRHVATVDVKKGTLGITKADGTTASYTLSGVSVATSAVQLGLFARQEKGTGTTHYGNTPMKVYSLRLWEDDALVHEFLPYKDGDVIGFRDTQTGNVITNCKANANSFKIGGMGVGGSGSVFKVAPQDCTVGVGDTRTLSAYAPGAVEYVWKKDGVVVEGATTGSLEVGWQKKPRESAYSVTPVYDIYGTRVEGAAATAEVAYERQGMVIFVR